jgi:hypothetical protein
VFEKRELRKTFSPKRDEVIRDWRKLRRKELRNLSSRMRWAGYAERTTEKMNAQAVLVEKPEGKSPLKRSRRRWED